MRAVCIIRAMDSEPELRGRLLFHSAAAQPSAPAATSISSRSRALLTWPLVVCSDQHRASGSEGGSGEHFPTGVTENRTIELKAA